MENEISFEIRGAIYEVYNALGPGLLESIYHKSLEFELVNRGLLVQSEVAIPVLYKNSNLELGFRLDLLVNDRVIIEIKSVEKIAGVHHKQLLTYLKLTNLRLGILVNFNVEDINAGIFRKVNRL